MPGVNKIFEEKNIHLAFDASLLFKGVIAVFETVGGVLGYFISQPFLLRVVKAITQEEITEDPRDLIANYLVHSVQYLSISAQHFTALYLFAHGVIKLWLIIGLYRKKLWYYPTAIVIFGLFVVYQLYRFNFTHSVWLLLITIVDVLVIWFTWHEYKYMKTFISVV